jgi:putative ABC transport system permease protein
MINQIDVVVDPAADVETVRQAVQAMLPAGLVVEEPALRKEIVRRSVGGFQTMLTAFSLLAVVAGFVVCYSRLQVIVAARTWEAGLLRAVGLRRMAVFAELLKESLLLGVAGAILGIPLGLVIGRVGVPYLATTTALNFRLPVPAVETGLRLEVLGVGFLVGLLAALLATIVPAVRLARTPPILALAAKGRDVQPARGRGRWGPRLAVSMAVVALVVWQHVSGLAALGLVTTAVIVLAAAMCAAPVTDVGARVLTAIWARLFGPVGRFAGGHVSRQPARSALTVATLGLGLGTVLLFGMLAWSFERTLVSRLTRSERSDMVISSAFVMGGYRSAPISERVLEELRGIPGVALVAGQQGKDIAYAGGTIVLNACDPACYRDRRLYEWQLKPGASADALERVARGEAVLVSTAFARAHGVEPGDTIELGSPTGPLAYPVAGISIGSPESGIWMSREPYRSHWNDTELWTANVALREGADYAAVESAIARQLGARHRLTARSTEQLIEYFAGEVRDAFSLLYLLEAVILMLVVIAIGDTLASGVLERTRELGMMRAVGLHRSRLFGIVLLEGAAIATLGLALAAVTGLVLGTFWVRVQFPALVGWDLDLHFPSGFALTALALTALLCAAGSFLPALRASRLSAAEALRNE